MWVKFLTLKRVQTVNAKRFLFVVMANNNENANETVISEGLATVKTEGKVFYNPVQEFNRDLSIAVLNTFSKLYKYEKTNYKRIKEVPITDDFDSVSVLDTKDEGLSILEALSATGLRSIRYAKEVVGVKQIVANDFSKSAVESIKNNINANEVNHIVSAHYSDATMLMYERRNERFDCIDLDPYGCPAAFLDGAVQCISDGGLLMVTATDMAVLAGNSPETCYSKYGAISLRMRACHEMALRILLKCIESHANRYGRYIVPLLSISADFYIRVFVRLYTSPSKCKYSLSKLATVAHCTGCDIFELRPLGILKSNDRNNQVKFALPTGAAVKGHCDHCKHSMNMGGPIWAAPIHDFKFVEKVLSNASPNLGTYKRIEGVLSVILEELPDVPLYYTLDRLSGTVHSETPSMIALRSAILNAGYQVSFTHMHRASIKTNAPAQVIWDIMRCWVRTHPVSERRLAESACARNILETQPTTMHSFDEHPDANPASRRKGVLRFQENPQPYWGPGTRSTAMVGDTKMEKSKRNQGKRKRGEDDENSK